MLTYSTYFKALQPRWRPEKHDLQCPFGRSTSSTDITHSLKTVLLTENSFHVRKLSISPCPRIHFKENQRRLWLKLQEYSNDERQLISFLNFYWLNRKTRLPVYWNTLCKKSDNEANHRRSNQTLYSNERLNLACSQFDILKSSRLIKEIQQDYPLTPLSYINTISEMMYQRYMYSPRINTMKY